MSKTTKEKVGHKIMPLTGRPKPLADQVYDRLLNLITSPQMPPGSRLAIDALVRELKVSQTPIRQALVRLETQGMVISEHNIGYSTHPLPTAETLAAIFGFRLMIEPECAKLAAERATEEDTIALEKLAQDMETVRSEGDFGNYGRFAAKDSKFHELILKLAGNSIAVEAIIRLNLHSHLFRLHFHQSITDDALKEHRSILHAIAKKDGEGARKAMKLHIQKSRKRLEPHF